MSLRLENVIYASTRVMMGLQKNERILEVGKLKLHTNCINNELNCYGIMNFTRQVIKPKSARLPSLESHVQ